MTSNIKNKVISWEILPVLREQYSASIILSLFQDSLLPILGVLEGSSVLWILPAFAFPSIPGARVHASPVWRISQYFQR